MDQPRNIESATESRENSENLLDFLGSQEIQIRGRVKKPKDKTWLEKNLRKFALATTLIIGPSVLISTEGCGRGNKTNKKVNSPAPVVLKDEGPRRVMREFDTDNGYRIHVYSDNTPPDAEKLVIPELKPFTPIENNEAKEKEHKEKVEAEHEEKVEKPKAVKIKTKTKEEKAEEKRVWEIEKAEKLKAAREYLEKLDEENAPKVKNPVEVLPGSEEDHLNKDVHLKMHDEEEKAIRNKPQPFKNYYQ